ncbi:sigma-54-dependent Fis family transcriptional regulator [Cellvibrio sp. pealriver]|uniref:sigma-54 interaction domain-containing protein n=1 Tax=Cellvibrio sp. pealriver TaxID=1622269 RepID=UPI00066FD113|nr:sigma-54 dependent transcriptional regulator [Cellvibrio sp. pealriver]
MSQENKAPVLLSLEGTNAQPLSVRAKALVFSDPISASLLEYIERIAPSEAPVLIGGETGTGKELVARHIHLLSGRRGPFLAVNCGAISDQLAESELFGHEAGSFTGAVGKREGWFEAANGGTLFLDEIGDLPLPLQVKLLRVLQEKEVVRIGSRKSIPVDVRLVVATNVDLDYAVSAGHFRRDLLYRINIAHVKLPPLRQRPGDILPLAEHFLKTYSQRMGYRQPQFSQDAVQLLLNYAWPGNIRELENVVHFALLVSSGDKIEPAHLKVTGGWNTGPIHQQVPQPVHQPFVNSGAQTYNLNTAGANVHSASFSNTESHSNNGSGNGDDPMSAIAKQLRRLFTEQGNSDHFDKLESLIVHEAFAHVRSNQVHGAALLGISRNVMRTLLKRHGLLADTGFTPAEEQSTHNDELHSLNPGYTG